VLTIFSDVRANLGHGIADSRVRVEQVVVFPRIPLSEGGELLGDGREETNNDTNRCALHLAAELVDGTKVRDTVVAVELNQLPDCEEDSSEHEDGRPVLQLVATVDRLVEGRQLLKDILLQLTPHVGKSTLDLEVDHDRRDGLARELGLLVLDLTGRVVLVAETLNHGNVESQVVGKDELERLADDGKLLAAVEAVGGLQQLGDEVGALKVLINKLLETTVDVAVKVVREHSA
jgi:hypothetical protein